METLKNLCVENLIFSAAANHNCQLGWFTFIIALPIRTWNENLSIDVQITFVIAQIPNLRELWFFPKSNVGVQAYVGDTVEDKPHKRNSVRLAIRKVRLAFVLFWSSFTNDFNDIVTLYSLSEFHPSVSFDDLTCVCRLCMRPASQGTSQVLRWKF